MRWITQVGQGFVGTLLEMSPYLLLGFFMAGLLSIWISPETVERHLGHGRFRPVIKAALFGVPLPLCCCGVIPVAATLRRQGANRGATTAFLISTPQTGVDSILVTYSLIGLVFAIFRPVAALVSGIAGGLAVSWLDGGENENAGPARPVSPACCAHEHQGKNWLHGLYHGFVVLPRDLANPLLIGLLAAALITAIVPQDFFAGGSGRGFETKLAMMLLGTPVYVCATASVPLAGAFMAAGISPGAALVFLMTGPATNAATMVTIWKTMGKRTAFIYLMVIAVSALLCGEVLDRLYPVAQTMTMPGEHELLPVAVQAASAVVVLVVLLAARYGIRRSGQA